MVQAVYGLWLARNETRDGRRIAEPHEIMQKVVSYVEEWKEVHSKEVKPVTPQPRQPWEAPEVGWIKANADGAVSKHREKGGAGVILRDHVGAFRAAACHFLRDAVDPETVELQACRRAIQVAAEVNVGKFHLECDNQGVVSMINHPDRNLSAVGPLVEEIKTMLQSFEQVRVTWVKRSANAAADRLAKMGMGDELCKVWLAVPPDCILDIVSDEISVYT